MNGRFATCCDVVMGWALGFCAWWATCRCAWGAVVDVIHRSTSSLRCGVSLLCSLPGVLVYMFAGSHRSSMLLMHWLAFLCLFVVRFMTMLTALVGPWPFRHPPGLCDVEGCSGPSATEGQMDFEEIIEAGCACKDRTTSSTRSAGLRQGWVPVVSGSPVCAEASPQGLSVAFVRVPQLLPGSSHYLAGCRDLGCSSGCVPRQVVFDGLPSADGSKMVAALKFFIP